MKDGELKAAPGAEQMYVPFIRTNNLDVAETNWMVSAYSDGAVATNEFSWAADGESYKEVPLELGGRLTNVNDKAILVLLNTNQVAVASNSVTCAAIPANSAAFPYLPGAVETLPPGEWSVDAGLIAASSNNVETLRNNESNAIGAFATATNALANAIAAYDAATNELANAVATSNTTYGVYIERADLLADAIAAYDLATNGLAIAIAAYEDATNDLANAVATSNATYGVYVEKYGLLTVAIEEFNLATNELSRAISAYDGATNDLAVAVATSNTAYGAYIEKTGLLALATEAYSGAAAELADAVASSNSTYGVYTNKSELLDKTIKAYDNATNALAEAWATSNTTYEAYVVATNGKEQALENYETATNALPGFVEACVAASNNLAVAEETYGKESPEYAAAMTEYAVATNALAIAEDATNATYTVYMGYVADIDAYTNATNAIPGAINATNTAYLAYVEAQGERDTARANYDTAVSAVEAKQSIVDEKATERDTAQNNRDNAKSEYDDAVAEVDEKQGLVDEKTTDLTNAQSNVEAKTTERNAAQTNRDNAKGAYDDAVAKVDEKQGVVDEKTEERDIAQGEADTKTTDRDIAQTNRDNAKSEYDDAVANVEEKKSATETKRDELTAAQTDAETKAADMGNAIKARQDAEGKFFLVVNGGIAWDDALIALNRDVFEKSKFYDWCTNNQVSLIYLDTTNSVTGASLFSYKTAVGASFVSLNGLNAAQCAALANAAAEAAETLGLDDGLGETALPVIALVRAEGSVCGCLRPQVADGACNLNENIARLDDLLKIARASDPESSEVAYDETASVGFSKATLHVNDNEKKINVTGIPADTYFDIEIDVPKVADGLGFEFELQAFLETITTNRVRQGNVFVTEITTNRNWSAVDPVKPGTWMLSEENLATNIYLKLSAYPDASEIYDTNTDFTVGFRIVKMQDDAGRISLTETSRKIAEGSATSIPITVKRTEWHSGVVTGYLTLVESETTAKPYRFSWPTNDAGEYVSVPLVWADREWNIEKTFDLPLNDDLVWDGDEMIVVELTGIGEYDNLEIGDSKFTLTIAEDDTKNIGKIAFVDTATVFAKENTDITLAVGRFNGANDVASVGLKATAGTLQTEKLSWSDKDLETVKYATLTLPSLKSGQTQASLYVSLVRDGEAPVVANASRVQVRVLPHDAPTFEAAAVPVSGVQTKAVNATVALTCDIPDGATVTLSRSAGSVPAGVTVKYDKTLNSLVVSGIPTGYGDFSATYQVIVRSGGKTVYSMPVTLGFALESRAAANAFVAVARAFTDLPAIDATTNRLAGLLDVTLPVNGRHTAKLRKADGKSISFTATGWSDITAAAAIVNFTAKSGQTISFSISEYGEIEAIYNDPATGETYNIARDAGEPWSAAYQARDYQGNYAIELAPIDDSTSALCTGAASLSLSLNGTSALRTGKVKFAGTLPNGRSISGSATLTEAADATCAVLPVMNTSASDSFSGVFSISNGINQVATNYAAKAVFRYDTCAITWKHIEKNLPDEYSYSREFSAYGSYIPPALDWGAQWMHDCGTADLVFSAEGTADTALLTASGKTVKIKDANSNALGLSIRSFNSATGAISGTAKFGGRTLSWSGILIPDWQEARPMMSGCTWVSVSEDYLDKSSKHRKASVRIGGGATLDIGE